MIILIISCSDDSINNSQSNEYFNISIEETGESTLFIFLDTINNLNNGDEIGIFDTNGVMDSQGNFGEILVGSGIWNGSQLEITAIGSIDLSQFGSTILPGYGQNNSMSLKIWDGENLHNVTYNIESGNGNFNSLFTAIDQIIFNNN